MSEQPQNPELENQVSEQLESENKIVAQRTLKVRELEAMNINPWGERYDGVEKCAALREKFNPELAPEVEQPACAAGRLMAMRLMGKSIFANIQDSSGRMQLFVGKNDLGDEAFALFKKLDIGDIIGVKGLLFTTRTGELTIKVGDDSVVYLAVAHDRYGNADEGVSRLVISHHA